MDFSGTLKDYQNISNIQADLKSKPENYWIKRGQGAALALFHQMAERVPAYKDFLDQKGLDHKKIKKIEDFSEIPPVDKDNYLRKYPRKMLCWDGDFKHNAWSISTTSGSTGEPYYFPRLETQDLQYAIAAELYLRENFQIQDKSTLYIVAFPMGAWIGGVFTYEALRMVARNGDYNLSVITPGIHKNEIINSFKNLADDFDQVLIGSYGPFLKDILDDGARAGVDWADHDLGFIFSAEVVSEMFRDYVIRKTNIDTFRGSLNHYGTVDMGTMAHETPLAIMLRRHALKKEKIYQEIFSQADKLPTLAQYLPEMFYFEEQSGSLICSANSGIPLVRYDLKDRGGIFTLEGMSKNLEELGYNIKEKAEEAGIAGSIWNLPFVYVYERADFSVSYYAFLVYPETIRRALERPEVEDYLTGKFTLEVKYNDEGRQKLVINTELKANQEESEELRNKVQQLATDQLTEESSEFVATYRVVGEEVYPKIVFWPYEDKKYFEPGGKQQWVKKQNNQ